MQLQLFPSGNSSKVNKTLKELISLNEFKVIVNDLTVEVLSERDSLISLAQCDDVY